MEEGFLEYVPSGESTEIRVPLGFNATPIRSLLNVVRGDVAACASPAINTNIVHEMVLSVILSAIIRSSFKQSSAQLY